MIDIGRIIASACLALTFLLSAPDVRAQIDARLAWTVAAPSIFEVEPTWPGYQKPGFGAPAGTAPEGTGVAILRPGLIITAAHVVFKATEVHVRAPDSTRLAAKVFVDQKTDIAFLTVEHETSPIALAETRPDTGAPVAHSPTRSVLASELPAVWSRRASGLALASTTRRISSRRTPRSIRVRPVVRWLIGKAGWSGCCRRFLPRIRFRYRGEFRRLDGFVVKEPASGVALALLLSAPGTG